MVDRRRGMSASEIVAWATLAAMIFGGGMWMGRLQYQVSQMQQKDLYLHGDVSIPGGK